MVLLPKVVEVAFALAVDHQNLKFPPVYHLLTVIDRETVYPTDVQMVASEPVHHLLNVNDNAIFHDDPLIPLLHRLLNVTDIYPVKVVDRPFADLAPVPFL